MVQKSRWQRICRKIHRVIIKKIPRRMDECSNVGTVPRRKIATGRHEDARNFILRHTWSERAVPEVKNALPNISPIPRHPRFKSETCEVGNQITAEVYKRRIISIQDRRAVLDGGIADQN